MQYNVILKIVISSIVSAQQGIPPPNCITLADSECPHMQQSIFPSRYLSTLHIE
jgi:hypothetical protein